MAADDLTGPPVLKLQSRDNLSGRRLEATPVSAGLPRNIGHGDAPEAALPASRLSAMPAGQIATSMVAATVRIPRVEWIGVMFYSLSPSFPQVAARRRVFDWREYSTRGEALATQ